ncbi:hypothetical protein BBR01nite_55060 [Brevibacillus brevis]|nr:hypothetical protein BBR01nite_55060 [Brevibacillus brevis]
MQHGGDEQAKAVDAKAFTCSFLRRLLLPKARFENRREIYHHEIFTCDCKKTGKELCKWFDDF